MNCQSYAARYGEAIGPKGGPEGRTEWLGVLEPGEPIKPAESQRNVYFFGGQLNITKQGASDRGTTISGCPPPFRSPMLALQEVFQIRF
jgi:hypothetical protein